MTTATAPRTQILTRGSHAWRITRYTDTHFVAVNNKGVTRIYNSEKQCDSFWNFLESVGFRLRNEGWSLATLVKTTPAPAEVKTDDDEVPADLAAYRASTRHICDEGDGLDWRDRHNASK